MLALNARSVQRDESARFYRRVLHANALYLVIWDVIRSLSEQVDESRTLSCDCLRVVLLLGR